MEVPHALHRATPAELKERLAADRRGTPCLLYRDGDGEQRIRDLGDAPERLTVGRAAGSGIPLTWDEEASRVHARLEHIDGEWTLVDDGGSRNGSFVNGERLSGRRRLGDGDTVRLGRTLIAFRRPTGQDSQLTVTAEGDAAPPVSEAQRRVLVALCRPCALTPFAVPASNQQIADELVLG